MYTIYRNSHNENQIIKSLMSELCAIRLSEIWNDKAKAFNFKVNYFVKKDC